MNILTRLFTRRGAGRTPAPDLPGELPMGGTETGLRPSDESRLRNLYGRFMVDFDLRATILDIRRMDRLDGRVKKIHVRTARAGTSGGLVLRGADAKGRLVKYWDDFSRRIGLWNRAKLESDWRGLMMEGNLPMQWVLDADHRVVSGIRMPAETIKPMVGEHGRFLDPAAAYEQWDMLSGQRVARFALWQLTLGRLSPDNVDDLGAMGRPYLDASRVVWQKLTMTEEDLVIRRRERAPLRTAHFLEGATADELESYRAAIEQDQRSITTNYYSNRKGSVSAIQGDANLDQIADVAYLLDTFFAASPAPKGLFGYVGDLSRDILEDLKRDFFEELDALADTLAWVYEQGFRLDLLLRGINPDAYDAWVEFAERKTETPNQSADRALKLQALGASRRTALEIAGLDPDTEEKRREEEMQAASPYPNPLNINRPSGAPKVSITPGNAPKGESATSIRTANRPAPGDEA